MFDFAFIPNQRDPQALPVEDSEDLAGTAAAEPGAGSPTWRPQLMT